MHIVCIQIHLIDNFRFKHSFKKRHNVKQKQYIENYLLYHRIGKKGGIVEFLRVS